MCICTSNYLLKDCSNILHKAVLWHLADNKNILKTYNLYSYLDCYLKDCTFPSKSIWRKIGVDTINNHEITRWKEEMLNKPNFTSVKKNSSIFETRSSLGGSQMKSSPSWSNSKYREFTLWKHSSIIN